MSGRAADGRPARAAAHLRQPRRPGPRAQPAAGPGHPHRAARGDRPLAGRHDGRGLPRPANPPGLGEDGGHRPCGGPSPPSRQPTGPSCSSSSRPSPTPSTGWWPTCSTSPGSSRGPSSCGATSARWPTSSKGALRVHGDDRVVVSASPRPPPGRRGPAAHRAGPGQPGGERRPPLARRRPTGRGPGLGDRRPSRRGGAVGAGPRPGRAGGRAGADLLDVRPGRRRRPGRRGAGHRQGLRRGPRAVDLGGGRRGRRRPLRGHPPVANLVDRCRPEVARILLVDDDRSLLRALRIGLGARGYEVVEAHNGTDGGHPGLAHHPRRGGARPGPARPRRDRGLPAGPPVDPGARSSCCRRRAARTARWRPSTPGPTTT